MHTLFRIKIDDNEGVGLSCHAPGGRRVGGMSACLDIFPGLLSVALRADRLRFSEKCLPASNR